ncbi:hypothetical protein H2248_003189 [Termitomyces sp. 'cryptogamus']|nr:hypothetical protein H2248_003189 [Termitomyces sp. 'cryptogamus']
MSQLQPSRIPQHTSSDIQRTAKQSTDASQINSILLALGAPTISSDDFNRLYQGPFGELLLFMSTQIKGRRQVAKDRHLIQQIRESHSRLPARLPSNNPVRQSMAKLSNIQRETNMLNEHLREKQAELEQAQSQVEYLKRVLQEKRRVVLLLSVLEGRERVRISRFQELTKMMNTTRIPSVEASSVIKESDLVSSVDVVSRRQKLSYTREVMINFHAYHARLCRIKESEHEPSSLITSRLRLRLSKKISLDHLEDVLERCCGIARAKAMRKMRYHDAVLSTLPYITKEDLSNKARANELRRRDLQKLSDKSIALGFLCEHLIASIPVFLDQTSHILRSSILEYTPNIRGYIDIFRLHLSASERPRKREGKHSLIEEVSRTCKIRTSQDPDAVIEAVKEILWRVKKHSSYLATVDALHLSTPPEEEVLIAKYYENVESVEKRAQILLTRKLDKAVLGETLVEDIDTLMKDTRSLVG